MVYREEPKVIDIFQPGNGTCSSCSNDEQKKNAFAECVYVPSTWKGASKRIKAFVTCALKTGWTSPLEGSNAVQWEPFG